LGLIPLGLLLDRSSEIAAPASLNLFRAKQNGRHKRPWVGSTTALIFFGNQTSGAATSYQINAPAGTALAADSAEWIVETPYVNGALTDMPDYGQVFFSNCEGDLTDGTVVNGGTGNNINLVQNGATLIDGRVDYADDYRVPI
jgi:hypothetical protein